MGCVSDLQCLLHDIVLTDVRIPTRICAAKMHGFQEPELNSSSSNICGEFSALNQNTSSAGIVLIANRYIGCELVDATLAYSEMVFYPGSNKCCMDLSGINFVILNSKLCCAGTVDSCARQTKLLRMLDSDIGTGD